MQFVSSCSVLLVLISVNVKCEHSGCPHEDDLLWWNDTAAWSTNIVPSEGDSVVVTNHVLLGESSQQLKSITIENGARLVIYPGDIQIITDFIHIKGRMDVGSEDCPYSGNLTITLTGQRNIDTVENFGEKFIGVDDGGTLELHGEEKVPWTKLSSATKSKVFFDHKPNRPPFNVPASIKGVLACVVKMDGPEVENCTGYRIGGGIKYFAKQAINQLIDMLSGVPDGDVVMIAAQRTLTSNSAPDEMLDLCFALEEFGWGESRNQSVLRHANTTDGYVFIGRRNSSSFTEERLGTRLAELTKIDFDTGLKLETSSLIDIDSPQNNAVKLRIRKIFPDISVIEKVSSWQPGITAWKSVCVTNKKPTRT